MPRETRSKMLASLRCARRMGYTKRIRHAGILQGSELACFTGQAGKETRFLCFRPEYPFFCFAVLADGSILDGTFHQFRDGSICLG